MELLFVIFSMSLLVGISTFLVVRALTNIAQVMKETVISIKEKDSEEISVLANIIDNLSKSMREKDHKTIEILLDGILSKSQEEFAAVRKFRESIQVEEEKEEPRIARTAVFHPSQEIKEPEKIDPFLS